MVEVEADSGRIREAGDNALATSEHLAQVRLAESIALIGGALPGGAAAEACGPTGRAFAVRTHEHHAAAARYGEALAATASEYENTDSTFAQQLRDLGGGR